MGKPTIKIESLSHVFEDGRIGLNDINLTVHPGEFIILAGKNGSGKTTLIRHLNGLLHPGTGKVIVDGKEVSEHPLEARKTIGMVFQDTDTQIVADTVYDETAFGLENLKFDWKTIDQTVTQVLTRLDLLHLKDKNPAILSGGQKRRLAIAGILVMNPKVIVFDEPFSNLDYPSILTVLKIMVKLNQEGKTIIIAAHDIEPLICEASRMILLDNGVIQKDAPPLNIIDDLESFGVRSPCFAKFEKVPRSWLV